MSRQDVRGPRRRRPGPLPRAGPAWVEIEEEGAPAFGPPGSEDVILTNGGPLKPPIHLAFAAENYEQVEGFHREGFAAASTTAPRVHGPALPG